MTYHLCIQKGIVEGRIGLEQLAPQVGCIPDVFEQGYVHWIRLIVREREGPYQGHVAMGRDRLR